MELPGRQVDANAFTAGFQQAGLLQRAVVREQHQPQAAAQHQQGLGLVGTEVAMGGDVGAGLEAHRQAVARLLHGVQVVVLAQARAGRGACGQAIEQRLVEEARGHGGHMPLTAKMPAALRQ